jgi:hypothetical protein
MTDKNVHRMKKNVNSRNVKSRFHCKYENSTYTSTYIIRGNKLRKKNMSEGKKQNEIIPS